MGVKTLAGFTWKDLLDLDACTECGRCTSVCPANTVGKELSPRDIILHLRDLMHGGRTAIPLSHRRSSMRFPLRLPFPSGNARHALRVWKPVRSSSSRCQRSSTCGVIW